jgi:nucleobase:cation symporter-1, NCS1 family
MTAFAFIGVALTLSILPVIPGFLRAAVTPGGQVANPTVWDSLYTYAWFVTFAASFALYVATFRAGTPSDTA